MEKRHYDRLTREVYDLGQETLSQAELLERAKSTGYYLFHSVEGPILKIFFDTDYFREKKDKGSKGVWVNPASFTYPADPPTLSFTDLPEETHVDNFLTFKCNLNVLPAGAVVRVAIDGVVITTQINGNDLKVGPVKAFAKGKNREIMLVATAPNYYPAVVTSTINVIGDNEPPIVQYFDDQLVCRNAAQATGTFNVLDLDNTYESLTVEIAREPTRSTVVIDKPKRTYTISPLPGESGDDSFVIRVKDPYDAYCEFTVNYSIKRPPELFGDTEYVIDPQVNMTFRVNVRDSDTPLEQLSLSYKNDPSLGTLAVVPPVTVPDPGQLPTDYYEITYTPKKVLGVDKIVFKCTDSDGLSSADFTVSLSIEALPIELVRQFPEIIWCSEAGQYNGPGNLESVKILPSAGTMRVTKATALVSPSTGGYMSLYVQYQLDGSLTLYNSRSRRLTSSKYWTTMPPYEINSGDCESRGALPILGRSLSWAYADKTVAEEFYAPIKAEKFIFHTYQYKFKKSGSGISDEELLSFNNLLQPIVKSLTLNVLTSDGTKTITKSFAANAQELAEFMTSNSSLSGSPTHVYELDFTEFKDLDIYSISMVATIWPCYANTYGGSNTSFLCALIPVGEITNPELEHQVAIEYIDGYNRVNSDIVQFKALFRKPR